MFQTRATFLLSSAKSILYKSSFQYFENHQSLQKNPYFFFSTSPQFNRSQPEQISLGLQTFIFLYFNIYIFPSYFIFWLISCSIFSKSDSPPSSTFSAPNQISLDLQTSHPSAAYIHHRQTTQDLSRFQIKVKFKYKCKDKFKYKFKYKYKLKCRVKYKYIHHRQTTE